MEGVKLREWSHGQISFAELLHHSSSQCKSTIRVQSTWELCWKKTKKTSMNSMSSMNSSNFNLGAFGESHQPHSVLRNCSCWLRSIAKYSDSQPSMLGVGEWASLVSIRNGLMVWKQYQKKLWNVACWVTEKKNTKPTKTQTSEYCQSGHLHLKSWNNHFSHHVDSSSLSQFFKTHPEVVEVVVSWSDQKKNHLPASNSGVLGVRGGSTDLLETTANGDLQLLHGVIVDSRFLFERHFGGFSISNPTISASLLHSGWSNSLLGLVMAILTFAHKSTSQVDLTREEAAIYNTITVSL